MSVFDWPQLLLLCVIFAALTSHYGRWCIFGPPFRFVGDKGKYRPVKFANAQCYISPHARGARHVNPCFLFDLCFLYDGLPSRLRSTLPPILHIPSVKISLFSLVNIL